MIKVFISGSFNVLHPGHLRIFRFAKECGDKLIVGVFSDDISGVGAYVGEELRLEGVKSNIWVDEVFLIKGSLEKVIEDLKPDIVVKGKEHELKYNPELSIIEKYGGKLLFSSGEIIFSSIDLIRKEFLEYKPSLSSIPHDYLSRHDLSIPSLIFLLQKFSKLKICVIGDLIIDEYIACQPLGMSQEDPTIVVTPIESRKFLGGAGIVAAHAAGLGAEVSFISVTGNDLIREFATKELSNSLVKSFLLIDENRPTTLKQRFRSKGKTLLRVSHLHQGAISIPIQEEILKIFKDEISGIDLLVFSDFNYGCLPQSMVDLMISIAKSRGVMMAADSQSSSQVGDIGRFMNMDLLTPTEHEARISTRNQQDGLVVLAEQLKKQSNSKNILLKMGEEGLLIHAEGEASSWLTDRIGALNSAAKDVSGAGDSLLITSAMALASGGNIWEAAFLGSLSAAVQVGRVGNIPIKTVEILEELN